MRGREGTDTLPAPRKMGGASHQRTGAYPLFQFRSAFGLCAPSILVIDGGGMEAADEIRDIADDGTTRATAASPKQAGWR